VSVTEHESDTERTIRLIRPDIDTNGLVPLYHQVAQSLVKAITNGELTPGAHLGGELQIGDGLGLSRPTIRKAISMLADRGLVVRRRGIGTIVMATSVRRHVALTSLYEDLSAMGRSFSTEVLGGGVVPADERVAAGLGVGVGDEVTFLRRLRRVDGTPLSVMENYLPTTDPVFAPSSVGGQSLYVLMERHGLRPAVASQVVSARLATDEEARLLEVRQPCVLLTAERTSFDERGRPVELSGHVFLAETYSFEMNLVRSGE
jgi:DNA-binding GntR family transcriptional regulator